jgi:hypothetical protein
MNLARFFGTYQGRHHPGRPANSLSDPHGADCDEWCFEAAPRYSLPSPALPQRHFPLRLTTPIRYASLTAAHLNNPTLPVLRQPPAFLTFSGQMIVYHTQGFVPIHNQTASDTDAPAPKYGSAARQTKKPPHNRTPDTNRH